MLETLFDEVVGPSSGRSSRTKGAAFLQAARDLYQLTGLAYLCVNIPITARSGLYAHCCYSDVLVISALNGRVSTRSLVERGLMEGVLDWEPQEWGARVAPNEGEGAPDQRRLTFPLPPHHEECALFGIGAVEGASLWEDKKQQILREVRILADYLHSHVLRINGHKADSQILISARELDCLKWTAAGKTAWEASVILGISERTVRFHLNAAREKLACATTTQAVAKAITQRLIEMRVQ